MISTCLRHLDKPVYVIRMNFSQNRWDKKTRLKWLRTLRQACLRTIDDIDRELERQEG